MNNPLDVEIEDVTIAEPIKRGNLDLSGDYG